jgi:hypothetical protein
MTVWDELRVALARLADEQPSPLQGWPDASGEPEQPPPYRITLAAPRWPRNCT